MNVLRQDIPVISVVTATLNRRDFLEIAIKNILSQWTTSIEHIIIDGGSTDSTADMLAQFSHLRVVSEPDQNLYDAWNKGIKLARGRFICLLNSDDQLTENALSEALRLIAQFPEADMISGPVELERRLSDGKTTRHLINDKAMISLREQDISSGIPLTNGRLISRRLIDRIGLFDTRYSAISDRQFFLRALMAKAYNVTTEVPLYRYTVHSGSLTLSDQKPWLPHAKESQQAALDGMAEAPSDEDRAAYRRWHSWATFYRAYLSLREGDINDLANNIAQSVSSNPAWFIRVLPAIWRHWRERQQRIGKVVP